MKILFITSNYLGDAIIATSIMKFFHQRHKNAAMTLITGPVPAELLEAPFVERMIPISKRRHSLHWWTIWRATRGTRWDIVVDLRGSALGWCLRAKNRYVWRPQPFFLSKREQQAIFLGCALNHLPLTQVWVHDKNLTQPPHAFADLKGCIALGPTANWLLKQWGVTNFAALAQGLAERYPDRPMISLGLASDAPQLHDLQQLSGGIVTPYPGTFSLSDIALILRHSFLFVGNDSGLTHVAAAAGAPTVGLYGPSADHVYHPVGPNVAWCRTDQDFPTVMAGYKEATTPPSTLMTGLEVDTVMATVDSLLKAYTATTSAQAGRTITK